MSSKRKPNRTHHAWPIPTLALIVQPDGSIVDGDTVYVPVGDDIPLGSFSVPVTGSLEHVADAIGFGLAQTIEDASSEGKIPE